MTRTRIQYLTSLSGLPNCFCFSFPHKTGSELYYFLNLLKRSSMFDGKEEHCHESIWSYQYDCIYKNQIPFTLSYDADYDMVSFAVGEKYMHYREELAEAIRNLIESFDKDDVDWF